MADNMRSKRLDLCETDHGTRYFRIVHCTAELSIDTRASFEYDIDSLHGFTEEEEANHALQLADFSIDDWTNSTREFEF